MNRASSAAGGKTGNRNEPQAAVGSEPRRSAAAVRRAIVRALGEGRKTPNEIEKAAAVILGPVAHASIDTQLRVLLDGDYVAAAKDDARKVELTDSGERWLRGIRALSAGRG